jgi:hypothetical protein
VQSAQLNFNFSGAAASESRLGIPNQSAWISEIRDGNLEDNLVLPETEESQSDNSSTTPLSKSLEIKQALQASADQTNASADQGQTAYKSVLWTAMHGKAEQEQTHPGQPSLSAAERQSQVQSVFASSPAQNGESAGAVSASPAQSSTPHAPEFVLQLADQIHIQIRDGKGEIRIQLKPDSLGRLEIRAENTIHGVAVRISTESSAVKSYLENNLQLLQQTLQDQGLKIDRIHIVVQDAFDSQSSSGFTAQFGHTGSGQNGKEPQFSSGKSGLSPVNPIEEGVLDPASWLALNPNNRFYTVA